MTLADEIEAGGGSDEAVARLFGWKFRGHLDETYVEWWQSPIGRGQVGCPAFLTDLNALAAECKRRNWTWRKELMPEGFALLVRTDDGKWGVAACKEDGTPEEDARALCAALVRAAEASDGRA